jgi:hypothetical protein
MYLMNLYPDNMTILLACVLHTRLDFLNCFSTLAISAYRSYPV